MPKQNNQKAKGLKRPRRTRRINPGSRAASSNFMQSAAVSVQELQGSSVPILTGASSRSGDLRVRVQHREFISDLSGSVAYSVLKFPVNPGLSSTFPWLSNIARNFESYQFNGLMFQYRNATSTSALGKVLYSVDWDAADAAPTNKQQQLQERTKADGAAWMNFDLRCDKADLLKFGVQRYIRETSLAANLDIKTYDVGNLWLGVQGQANTNVIGEFWVIYDVELITPNQVQPNPSPDLFSDSVQSGGGSVSITNIFGAVPVVTGGGVVTAAGKTLTFLIPGQYLLVIELTGTVFISASTITGTAFSAAGLLSPVINSASTAIFEEYLIIVGAANETVIISPSATTVTDAVMQIAPYTAANL